MLHEKRNGGLFNKLCQVVALANIPSFFKYSKQMQIGNWDNKISIFRLNNLFYCDIQQHTFTILFVSFDYKLF